MQQDAEAELQELQQQLQLDFQRKLIPVIQQLVAEKGLQILLSQADAGIVWADPGLDLTAEVIKRFDAAATAAPKPPASAAASRPRRGCGGIPGGAGEPAPLHLHDCPLVLTHCASDDHSAPPRPPLLPLPVAASSTRSTEHEPGERLVAVKNVTVNEEFFQGHFPGAPAACRAS